ncbi:hypothetical protein BDN71DRAFT_1586289 [Pleurotus eryngii]|uniref:F-box domain-containing protein n=1 Tax=Pleurotus eryngii TaxID=5323 RepID=A0A9P6A505_PLEER|nr:hypothetical protein BDN71DRAFT_1586289 [Pleurotus eryngii]
MISTMGYRASSSPPYGKTRFELGLASPLQLSSSLFVASRRPSIPLSLKLLHFPTSPSGDAARRIEGASCGHTATPINKLPVEILCDIFSICDETGGNQPCGSKIVLSHVCRRWRGVVLCMPMMWSHISVETPNRTSAERMTAHFRRSGAYPVSLTILEGMSGSLEQRDAIKRLLPIIRAHASQLKSLRLRLRTSAPDFGTYLHGCQFSLLEDLDLHLHLCPADVTETLISRFQHGSRLSSLVWRRSENLPTNITWCTLKRLELNDSYTLETVCAILEQCRSLQDLVVSIADDGLATEVPITLPALRTLDIHTQVPLARLFRRLLVPLLRAVSIHYRMDATIPRGWDEFNAFLRRSDCDLAEFALWDKRLDDTQLIQCLELSGLQSLTGLDIQQPPISENVLRRLSCAGDQVDLLPSLRHITLSDCRSEDGVLQDFVSSRLSHRPLDSLSIGLSDAQSRDRAYLRFLQHEGRNVRVYD